jgi:hypothetical protein
MPLGSVTWAKNGVSPSSSSPLICESARFPRLSLNWRMPAEDPLDVFAEELYNKANEEA